MPDEHYRVGNHQPQNLYRGDQYIGVMFDPNDAALIVRALNDETLLSQPARALVYRVDDSEPRCVYGRGEVFLGVMFTSDDAALVVRALNVAELL